jgi:hypothetical protein
MTSSTPIQQSGWMAASAQPAPGHERVQHYVPKAANRMGQLFVAPCGQYCRTFPGETGKGPICTVCERWTQTYPTS